MGRLYAELSYLDAYATQTNDRVERDVIGDSPIGKIQFDYLVVNGLTPAHHFFDLGCGTLRGGRHFIRYLEADHYTGFELSPKALAYAADLVEREGLSPKRPRLVLNVSKNLRFEQFSGKTFDYILAQSVFTHLMPEHIEECFAHIPSIMHDRSLFYFTFRKGSAYLRRGNKGFNYPISFFEEIASRYGLSITFREDYPHPRGQTMVTASKC
jgi:SAM-dependent methyltransferase